MRVVAMSAVMLMAAAACTDQETPTDAPTPAIESGSTLTFSDEPLWIMEEVSQAGSRAGLEQVYSVELVGDRLVLVGHDEDGDLNPEGPEGLGSGAVVVLDARTGDSIWSLPWRSPLPDDPLMTVAGFLGADAATETHVVEIDGQAALAVAYEKYANDFDDTTDTEIGVVALSLESGEPLASARVQDGSLSNDDLRVKGSDGAEVLLHVINDGEGSAATMVMDLASGDRTWTREGMAAVGMNGGTVLIEDPFHYLGEPAANVTFEAVDRASGETRWAHPESEHGGVVVRTFTDDVIVADSDQGGEVLDLATGEQLHVIEGGVHPGCAADETALIACSAANRGLELVPPEQTPDHAVELPDSDGFEPLAVSSGWVFTDQPGEAEGTNLALDAAGNSMDTPGKLAGHDDELAVFYTGAMHGEVGTISVHTVDS